MTSCDARIVELGKSDIVSLVDNMRYYYQPQFCLNSSSLKGYECLLRLVHPTQGVLSPAVILPLINEAGLWDVLWPKLLAKVQAEQRRHGGSLRLAINVSPKELERGEDSIFLNLFYQMSKAGELDARNVEIEITEEVEIHNFEQVNSSIYLLNHLGCTVVIDDFGAGYSNMSAFDRLNINGLKIDRGLVNGIETSNIKQAIVKSIVDIAKVKGCYTLAEGIETQSQLATIKELGCEFGQGFYLGHPNAAFIHKTSF